MDLTRNGRGEDADRDTVHLMRGEKDTPEVSRDNPGSVRTPKTRIQYQFRPFLVLTIGLRTSYTGERDTEGTRQVTAVYGYPWNHSVLYLVVPFERQNIVICTSTHVCRGFLKGNCCSWVYESHLSGQNER